MDKNLEYVLDAKNKHIEKVSKLNIKGCRGQLATNLILFAMSGEWSVTCQNYICNKSQYKLPIICIYDVLKMMVETREKVQEHLGEEDKVKEYVEAFQLFSVLKQEEYMDANEGKYDYMEEWSKAFSWSELTKNPLKNNKKWMFFFTTTEKKNIVNLMNDIRNVLRLHEEYLQINTRKKTCEKRKCDFDDMVGVYKKVKEKQNA